ncbi:unnamed protein product [Phaeothamnion confervicola]
MRSILEKAWLDDAEALVGDLESTSSAEIVVVVAPSSGNYRDAQLWVTIFFTWLVAAALILMPIEITDLYLLPLVLVGFMAGFALSRSPFFKYLLVRPERSRRQVAEAAVLAFHREHVSATRERTGILIYLSREEKDLEIVVDYRVDALIPQAVWNNMRAKILADRANWSERFLSEMKDVKTLLAEKLPRRDDDTDELSNRPRVMAA